MNTNYKYGLPSKPLPDQDLLLRLFDYRNDTGKLYWKARTPDMFNGTAKRTPEQITRWWNSRYAGREAFHKNTLGYRRGEIYKTQYLAHRIIWKMHHSIDPEEIDHINGDPSDNRISNLRSVSHRSNCKNRKQSRRNSSGVAGVYQTDNGKKWIAIIWSGKTQYLGRFVKFSEAVIARKSAEKSVGFHPNHDRPNPATKNRRGE